MTRRQFAGDDGTESKRSTFRKWIASDECENWLEAMEMKIAHKRQARDMELQLKRENL